MESNTTHVSDTFVADTSDYDDTQLENQPDYIRSQRIWIYGSPVIIILGTVGNLLSFLVMLRKPLRIVTTSLYLAVLAVVDTLILYTGLLRFWIRAFSGIEVRSFSAAGCKIHIFLVYFLMQFEPWILVGITFERLAAIFVPMKAKALFTRTVAAIQMLVTGVILAGFNLHYFWTYTIIEETVCYIPDEKYDYFVFIVWGWMDFCLASLIPFILMLSLNTAIIARLLRVRQLRAKKLNVNNDVKMTSMTAILLTINFVFFVTTAPIALYLSTQRRWEDRVETWADEARLELVWASVNIVAYLNNSVNFLLYIVSGPRFRKEAFKMLRVERFRIHPHPNTVNSTTPNNGS